MPAPEGFFASAPASDPNAAANARNAALLGEAHSPSIGGAGPVLQPDAPGPALSFEQGFQMETVGPGGPPPEAFGMSVPTPPQPDLQLAEQHHNLKCPKCDYVGPASAKKCAKCGHDLTQARKAKFANMGQSSVSVAEHLDLADIGKDKDGLIWKCICKAGTLALSPGPGQIDVEKPLELSREMFEEIVHSVEDQAFPHITVPSTHDNGLMENNGYIRAAQIRDAEDGDELWAGMEFTEPDTEKRVMNGSIADTSVGVKFNYRRKRDGKLFPAALEHVALTNMPWVDGLPAFGTALSQPYDQADDQSLHLGVFVHPEDLERRRQKPTPRRKVEGRAAQIKRETSQKLSGDILPRSRRPGGIPAMDRNRSRQRPQRRTSEPDKPESVETLLASQQAQIDRERAETRRLQAELRASQERQAVTDQQLHEGRVAARVTTLQNEGLPPALVQRFETIALADKPGRDEGEDLTLSITSGSGDDAKTEEQSFSPTELAEYLLAAVPRFNTGDVADIASQVQEFQASQQPASEDPAVKAQKAADALERQIHPERYGTDGKRKSEEDIAKAGL